MGTTGFDRVVARMIRIASDMGSVRCGCWFRSVAVGSGLVCPGTANVGSTMVRSSGNVGFPASLLAMRRSEAGRRWCGPARASLPRRTPRVSRSSSRTCTRCALVQRRTKPPWWSGVSRRQVRSRRRRRVCRARRRTWTNRSMFSLRAAGTWFCLRRVKYLSHKKTRAARTRSCLPRRPVRSVRTRSSRSCRHPRSCNTTRRSPTWWRAISVVFGVA